MNNAARWNDVAEKMNKTTDRLRMPIDVGIFDTVVALNVLGFTTIQSCEGHIGRALPYPWVSIGDERYQDEISRSMDVEGLKEVRELGLAHAEKRKALEGSVPGLVELQEKDRMLQLELLSRLY